MQSSTRREAGKGLSKQKDKTRQVLKRVSRFSDNKKENRCHVSLSLILLLLLFSLVFLVFVSQSPLNLSWTRHVKESRTYIEWNRKRTGSKERKQDLKGFNSSLIFLYSCSTTLFHSSASSSSPPSLLSDPTSYPSVFFDNSFIEPLLHLFFTTSWLGFLLFSLFVKLWFLGISNL